MRIVIEVEGGLVTQVTADGEVECLIVDRDTDGVDGDRLWELDGEYVAGHLEDVVVAKRKVGRIFRQYDNKKGG
jgi:hypothetical protein